MNFLIFGSLTNKHSFYWQKGDLFKVALSKNFLILVFTVIIDNKNICLFSIL